MNFNQDVYTIFLFQSAFFSYRKIPKQLNMQWRIFLLSVFYFPDSLNIEENRLFYANPHLKKAKFSANPHSKKCVFYANPHSWKCVFNPNPHSYIYMIFLFQSAFFSYRNSQSVVSHNYQYHSHHKCQKEPPFRESRSSRSILFCENFIPYLISG